MELFPALLVHSEAELVEKVGLIRRMAPAAVHVDVMDGKFVPNTTYTPTARVAELLRGIPFELHLMVVDPAAIVHEWLQTPAMRFIMHLESGGELERLAEEIHHASREVGFAINPATSLERIQPLVGMMEVLQVMGADPGFSGKVFDPKMYDRIREVRQRFPALTVSVDIGVNETTIPEMKSAGAQRCVSASAVFASADPVAAYKKLIALAI